MYRIVESFEELVSLYAQQVPVNSSQVFNYSMLSLLIERVSCKYQCIAKMSIEPDIIYFHIYVYSQLRRNCYNLD